MLCDGHTMSATISNSPNDLELSSERQSSVYEVDGSIVDKVQLHITGNSGAYVNHLILDNVDAWKGSLSFNRMKVGTATVPNSNRVGDGSGVDSASCVIHPLCFRTGNQRHDARPPDHGALVMWRWIQCHLFGWHQEHHCRCGHAILCLWCAYGRRA